MSKQTPTPCCQAPAREEIQRHARPGLGRHRFGRRHASTHGGADAKKAGKDARYGPTETPDVDFGESLKIETPWQGGDGRAMNDPKRTKKAAK